MLQQEAPADYVIASGETHSVRDFCERAFAGAGLDYRDYVKIDERFQRPAEIDLLVGDSSRARKLLGWAPEYTFSELVNEMLASDLKSFTGHTPEVRSS
jgi:GDPmannose 4,6-dehydratase